MDLVDRASAREDEIRAMQLAKVRAALSIGPSLLVCSDCGDEIPKERRLAVPGCKRCFDCQIDFEKRGGRT